MEKLKQKMVQVLFERKIFHKSRYLNKWFRVAVDGSGLVSYQYKHSSQCLHKTSKKGKTSYFYAVLEARLVTPNGFSLSLATEWIENPEEGDYDKQDCERKAFKRLAAKLKKAYPRLPIIILADVLYPYEGFFAICEANQWAYQCTFKKGNLTTVWDEVHALSDLKRDQSYTTTRYVAGREGSKEIVRTYYWVNDIDYNGRSINWIECHEVLTWTEANKEGIKEEKTEETTFTHITNLPLKQETIEQTSSTGRLRWKIENEGFNTLKNGGYGMKHKWARKSYQGLKNYFQFMQMAYLINQLMIKRTLFQEEYLQGKNHPTLINIWSELIAAMKWAKLKVKKLQKILGTRIQYRFIT